MQDEIKDNGTIQTFETGAVREGKTGKGMYHLIPTCSLNSTSLTFELGADRRGKRNWEKGMPLSVYWDSAQRHLLAIKDGDRSEDHFGRLNFNSAAFQQTKIWIEEGKLPKELDDLGVCKFEGSPLENSRRLSKEEKDLADRLLFEEELDTYYYLTEGNTLQPGDQCNYLLSGWQEVSKEVYGGLIGGNILEFYKVRRPIKKEYYYLKEGDKIEVGDEVQYDTKADLWTERTYVAKDEEMGVFSCPHRRKIKT